MAASVFGLGLLWNERSGRQATKDDLEIRIEAAKVELGQKLDAAKVELTAQAQHLQSIALGSAYATMKTLSGEPRMMQKWMSDIDGGIASGGVNCYPIQRIAAVSKQKIQQNK